ncbi:MAG: hypothetical protein ACJAXW_003273 [Candidatus Azotimanducaceae bacterium]|jgi:hypothetical protein
MNINLTSLLPTQGRVFDTPGIPNKAGQSSLEAIYGHKSANTSSANAGIGAVFGPGVGVAVAADQTPLTLAYQAAIDRINEAVAPYLGENAMARGEQAKVDVSPEVTAERIVSRSTALFSRFEDRYPDRDTKDTINHFVDTIRGGVEQGFSEAKDILKGLGVLNGDIKTNVDLTFERVLDGLAEFQSRALSDLPS